MTAKPELFKLLMDIASLEGKEVPSENLSVSTLARL